MYAGHSRSQSPSVSEVVVVTDASPLLALLRVGLAHLLHALYGEVLVPEAVDGEVRTGAVRSGHLEAYEALDGYRVVRAPSFPIEDPGRRRRLDPGEMEAIALCTTLERPLLLIDEAAGRRLAGQLGIRYTGVLGILVVAYQRGLIGDFTADIVRLREVYSFHLSDRLVRKTLADIGLGGT